MEIQKFECLENEKSFLDEIKHFFHSFWRTIIQWEIAKTQCKTTVCLMNKKIWKNINGPIIRRHIYGCMCKTSEVFFNDKPCPSSCGTGAWSHVTTLLKENPKCFSRHEKSSAHVNAVNANQHLYRRCSFQKR